MALLADVERRIGDRAEAMGIEPERPPWSLKKLMQELFQDDVSFLLFSDLGSHVGLGVAFLLGPPENSADRRENRTVMLRAAFLGLAAAVALDTTETVADALGQVAVVQRIQDYRAATALLLQRVVVKDPRMGPLYE